MKMHRSVAVSAAALAALAAQRASLAQQVFSFEDPETVVRQTPNMGTFTWLGGIAHVNNAYERTEGTLTRYEPTHGYVWGQSFESDSNHAGPAGFVNHTRSTLGATDGSYSMNLNDPDGNFAWGTQVLFNDLNDPRWTQLTTGTKMIVDITTPGGTAGLPDYAVGFAAINFGGGFITSYNDSSAGNWYQFASGPATQTEPVTQSYIYSFGEQMRDAAGSLWPGLTEFVILHFNNNSPAGVNTDFWYDNFRVINQDVVTRPNWKAPVASGGNWLDAANWNVAVPNGVGQQAIFYGRGAGTGTVAQSSTVTLNAGVAVGSIVFDALVTSFSGLDGPGGVPGIGAEGSVTSPDQLPAVVNYTIAGTGSITFDVAGGNAEVYAIAGSHSINVPVNVLDSLRLDTAAGFGPDENASLPGGGRHSQTGRAALTFGAPVTVAPGNTLRTSGAGTFTFNGPLNAAGSAVVFNGGRVNLGANLTADALAVAPAARVVVTPNAGNTVVRTRSLIVGDGTNGSQVDLTNNKLIVDYAPGASPLTDLRAMIVSGYNGGSWNGSGLVSSLANTNTHGLGYGEASAVFASFPATFGGQQVDDTSVLVRFTRYGDANLDGQVNLTDFNRLASNFGSTSAIWTQGDFNYDGLVNLADFNRLASNFGQSAAGSEVTPEDWAALASAVPEPATAVLALVPVLMLHRRRR